MIDDRLDRAGLLQQKLAGYRERGVSRVKLGLADLDDALYDDARRLFGEEFVEHFAMSRHWEFRECERHVNSWQLERYFEIV